MSNLEPRVAVLEALQEDLKQHMADDQAALLLISRKLSDIDAKLNNGLTETLKAVAVQQSEMQIVQTRHAVWIKILSSVFMATIIGSGIIFKVLS